MAGLIGVFFYIAIFIFVAFVSKKNKAKRAAETEAMKKRAASQAAAARTAAPVSPAFRPAQPTVKPFDERFDPAPAQPVNDERFDPAPAQPVVSVYDERFIPRPAQPMADTSETDSEGCVGGSLEHDHEEGESMAEHTEHMKRYERDENAVSSKARIRRGDMQRAVVMSEILGKPVSYRLFDGQ